MYRGIRIAALALLTTHLHACQRDRHFHHDGVNLKRQVTERLPLSEVEAVITSSFDNNSISDWSYYYVSGLEMGDNDTLTRHVDPWRPHRGTKRNPGTMFDPAVQAVDVSANPFHQGRRTGGARPGFHPDWILTMSVENWIEHATYSPAGHRANNLRSS